MKPAVKKCILVVLVALLTLLPWLGRVPQNFEERPVVLQRIKDPVPQEIQTRHPIFKKSCYNYDNISATNVCCKMKKYGFAEVEKCAQAFNTSQK